MNYLTTLKKLIKTQFKRSWQENSKNKHIKGTWQEDWLDVEIVEKINESGKPFQKSPKNSFACPEN